ncbi:MAG: 3'-5' exonuclease [Candidatus Magasanikbacteria bacterium]|nr:3'-5' exonuclease [Candidatus Magasanikbacteria bacterium]
MKKEIFISVDIEADGPIPGDYSMLSIGACVVGSPDKSFYMELKPISEKFDPEALRVCCFDRGVLINEATDPEKAMKEFSVWVDDICGDEYRPVFVAFNATFDWMFVHWYLIRFAGRNPFGISGLDIKAYYMGVLGKEFWADTSKSRLDDRFLSSRLHTHNALDDAREQADIFMKIRKTAGFII